MCLHFSSFPVTQFQLRLCGRVSAAGVREEVKSLHVEVLLGVLDVPLDLSVNVKVKLLGHRQGDQWRPLWVGFLTAVKKTHNDSQA